MKKRGVSRGRAADKRGEKKNEKRPEKGGTFALGPDVTTGRNKGTEGPDKEKARDKYWRMCTSDMVA